MLVVKISVAAVGITFIVFLATWNIPYLFGLVKLILMPHAFFQTEVSTTSNAGTSVITVSATDDDSGDFGRVCSDHTSIVTLHNFMKPTGVYV